MAIALNHTIVPAHDKAASAKFFAQIATPEPPGASDISPLETVPTSIYEVRVGLRPFLL